MSKKEVIKKWRLNKDSIVLIAFSNAFVEKVTPHFLSFLPSIFFTGKTKQNLKKLKSSCALKGCRTSGQFAIHTSADFLVVFFYPKDIDPCTNVTCDYHAICKAFSAFDARCVCDDNCPSYEEPVCSSNSTTFKNKCFCLLDICRRKSNHTLYHPGSCTGKTADYNDFLKPT